MWKCKRYLVNLHSCRKNNWFLFGFLLLFLNVLCKYFHACDYDDSDDDDDLLIIFTKKTSSSFRETRTSNNPLAMSEIETSDVEEIDSFCSDAEDDNDDESAHEVH